TRPLLRAGRHRAGAGRLEVGRGHQADPANPRMRRGSRYDERLRRGERLLLISGLCLAMLLPYLPGGYDASAAALSFVAQVASLLSVLLVPVIIVVGVLSFGGD